MNRSRWKACLIDIPVILIGTAIYAFGIYAFTAPNRIAPGGVTGIATVLHAFTGFQIGTAVSLINIPLLLVGVRFLGKAFILKTLLSTASFNLLMDVVFPLLPVYQGDLLLAAIFGGLFIGLGLAVVFMRGGSTGGMDIITKTIQTKLPHIRLGTIVFAADLLVILIAAVSFRSLEAALYAIVAMFVSSRTIDALIYGSNVGKMIVIVTERGQEIAAVILHSLSRGCTLLNAEGGYTGKEKKVLLCACKNAEFYNLKRIIRRIDGNAFLIVTEAGEVFGKGFLPNNH